jgi:CheY-like chemotaxis protein
VLLVDDNVDAADMLAELLRRRGHHVEVAHDAAAALAATTTFKPEVALLDIGLPVIDGYQLAARLLNEAPAPPPLLIALTGYGQDGDRKRAHSAGFSVHLVKPVKLDALLDAIALA